MEISWEALGQKVTWEVKALKGTEDCLGLQVPLGYWDIQVLKDQKDKRAVWENLAWRDLWVREGEKGPWDLAVNLDLLALERKETEELLVNLAFRAHLVSQVLRVPKVPVVFLALGGPQVPKGSKVNWGSLESKVTKDQ